LACFAGKAFKVEIVRVGAVVRWFKAGDPGREHQLTFCPEQYFRSSLLIGPVEAEI
jgi:hypothetical protein